MSKPINPTGRFSIPTEYKSITFRSKLEADWARFLDKLHIEWKYEPTGKYVDDTFVLCDFHLTATNDFLEIKGQWTPGERAKYGAFSATLGERFLFVGGPAGCLGCVYTAIMGNQTTTFVVPAHLAECGECDLHFFAITGTPGENLCPKCGGSAVWSMPVGKPSTEYMEWPKAKVVATFDPQTEWLDPWFYGNDETT